MTSITEQLFSLTDTPYQQFQSKLIPNIEEQTVIGVRTPALRALAKQLKNTDEAAAFLQELPHTYFEENQLHAFLISEEKDYVACIEKLEQFLPYVNNWATCDQMNPKVLKKNPEELLLQIQQWLFAPHPYTVRFAIKSLMNFFLDDLFEPTYLDWVSNIRSEEYYINMMIAWYFATALAKQYEATLPYLEEHRLSPWVHKKTIQKARESYRVEEEHKQYLSTLVSA